MKLNTKPIKDWFGFTRRERRSTFTLFLIIVIIIGLRFVTPDTKTTIVDITDSLFKAENYPVNDSARFYKTSLSPVNSIRGEFKTPDFRKPKIARSPIRKGSNYSNQKLELIELNSCDSVALIKLPGIGPVLSARIIKYRHLLGGYARIEQLKEVYGLPPETFDLIKNSVSADSTLIVRININTADYKELSHIRYFEKYEISSILKYKQLKGKITGMMELIGNKIITNERAKKVGPYLNFD